MGRNSCPDNMMITKCQVPRIPGPSLQSLHLFIRVFYFTIYILSYSVRTSPCSSENRLGVLVDLLKTSFRIFSTMSNYSLFLSVPHLSTLLLYEFFRVSTLSYLKSLPLTLIKLYVSLHRSSLRLP